MDSEAKGCAQERSSQYVKDAHKKKADWKPKKRS